ncbi:MAG: hypothetical protein PWP08_1109 [Methanofollis sp.]|nr:hypothetical protein [Methanofollis sp.]
MNLITGARVRASELEKTFQGDQTVAQQNLSDLLSRASDFLGMYERYLTAAITYQEQHPPISRWEGVGTEKSPVIALKKPKNMHSGTYRSIVNAFLESRWIYDGVIRAGKGEPDRIDVISRDPDNQTLTLSRTPSNDTISVSSPRYVLDRQLDAMYTLLNAPRAEHLPILRIFADPDFALDPPDCRIGTRKIPRWDILGREKPDGKETEGTNFQKQFVKIALSTPDFAFLEGPPGSGKTETICEVILQAVRKGLKVMLVAPTHTAVDNVLERVKGREEVVAVRISAREGKVDETVKEYHISYRLQTEKATLLSYLDTQTELSEAQRYFRDAISEDDEVTTGIILQSANLVCGTTIGILDHPAIKHSTSPPEPLYDLLILDEAGMVTFQEWLVPALYAKRWIFVGDSLQLSPYVDREELAANIDHHLKDERKAGTGLPEPTAIKEVCLNCFRALHSSGLVVHKNRENFNVYKKQAKSIGLDLIIVDGDDKPSFPKKNKGVLFLSTPESYELHREELQRSIRWIRGDQDEDLADPEKEDGEEGTENRPEKIGKNWEMEIAWRMDRIYQLRHYRESDGESFALRRRYEEDIDNLLPWWDDAFSERLRCAVAEICMVPLPSVMDLLQEGFSGYKGTHKNALTSGMNKNAFNARHVLLTYQHRSHSDIVRFSKEMLYKQQGRDCLNTPRYLNDLRKKEFPYSGYGDAAVWANYRDTPKDEDLSQYVNRPEANHLVAKLRELVTWANSHRPPGGRERWEFAALTFYGNQEEELRQRVRAEFGVKGVRTFDIGENVRLRVATIDRFQGHEADAVFLSMVNTTKVGFLDNLNRLNVALTRARNQLVIFGKKEYFKKQPYSTMLQKLAGDENPYYMILELEPEVKDEDPSLAHP